MPEKKQTPKIEDLKKKDLDPSQADRVKGGRLTGDEDDVDDLEIQRLRIK